MNIAIASDSLPNLVDRAASALTSARTSAEVLEARDLAGVAYDAAKSAGRMARAKKAHDDVLGAVYRAQADAALIEARAKIRLADEYDAAQERGEVHRHGGDKSNVGGDNVATTADLGLRRDEIHEARKLRDAEAAQPGLIERSLNAMVRPEPTPEQPSPRPTEPTKAALRASVLAAVEDAQRPESKPSRRNPDWKPDPENDRVLRFIDACETLAGISPAEMATWFSDKGEQRPGTRDRMLSNAHAASDVLNKFQENIKC